MRDLQRPSNEFRAVGSSLPKADAWSKATGTAIYAGDVRLPGALDAKVLRSAHPHARVVSIDTSAAEALPGVYAVATGKDVAPTRIGRFIKDRHALARDKVIYVGEPVAAVAAVDEETAEHALQLIDVVYEPLPAVFDAQSALAPDAPVIHPDLSSYQDLARSVREGNMRNRITYEQGDVDAAFQEPGAVVYEASYRTPRQAHAPTELHAAIAQVDPTGKVTIWATNKAPFGARAIMATTLGIPVSRVRMIAPVIGGDFGGKGAPFLEPIVALLARKARRPVRLVMSRVEEFSTLTSRPACVIRLKAAARPDGTLTALDGEMLINVGAVDDNVAGLANSVINLIGAYRIPNVRLVATSVYTNTSPSGHVRSPAGMPTIFAIESHVDALARMVGADPLEFRARNALREGDPGPASRAELRNVGLQQCIDATREWMARELGPRRPNQGIGVAFAHLGLRPAPPDTECTAEVKIDVDGSVVVLTGVTDQGAGQWNMCALMAAEVLGVPVDQVTVLAGDTEATPYEKGTGAAETTYRVGNIVRQAAADARERLLEMAGERLEVDEEELALRDGTVFVRSDPEKSVTIAELAQGAIRSLSGAIIGRSGNDPEEGAAVDFVDAPCLAVHVAQIAVDAESGLIEVQRYYTAQDVGRALNRLHCEGQIEGGIAWGLGYALSEELLAENGVTLNANLWEYLLTTAPHIPRIDFDMIEIPSTRGPFGAKGVGETSNLAVAPAIANALADATGVRVTEIPLTPERVASAIGAQRPGLPLRPDP